MISHPAFPRRAKPFFSPKRTKQRKLLLELRSEPITNICVTMSFLRFDDISSVFAAFLVRRLVIYTNTTLYTRSDDQKLRFFKCYFMLMLSLFDKERIPPTCP